MNALAYSFRGSYLAVWVWTAADSDLHFLWGRRFQLFGDEEIVDRPRNFNGIGEGLRDAPRVGRPDLHREGGGDTEILRSL